MYFVEYGGRNPDKITDLLASEEGAQSGFEFRGGLRRGVSPCTRRFDQVKHFLDVMAGVICRRIVRVKHRTRGGAGGLPGFVRGGGILVGNAALCPDILHTDLAYSERYLVRHQMDAHHEGERGNGEYDQPDLDPVKRNGLEEGKSFACAGWKLTRGATFRIKSQQQSRRFHHGRRA